MEDEVVIELVNQQIKEFEKNMKNYVIEGYPRTRAQAIGLQKIGIFPDNFFILTLNEGGCSEQPRKIMEGKGLLEYRMYGSAIIL